MRYSSSWCSPSASGSGTIESGSVDKSDKSRYTSAVQPWQTASFPAIPDRNRLNFSWLIKLRWAEIAGQSATILGVDWLLDIDIPVLALFAIVAIGLCANLAFALWFRQKPRVAEWHLAAAMALDVALLTGLLFFTGGPSNPFSFLYLVQIALAAVVLRAHWTWMLVALSFASFGILLLWHRNLPLAATPSVYQTGMWVALGVASAFIVHFLLRVVAALAERERELTEARSVAARQERLAALATMAAGAAHELSTPLSTIALVAKELEHALARQGAGDMAEDARLIRTQTGRCRMILDQMACGAGENPGEAMQEITVKELIEEALSGARDTVPVQLEFASDEASAIVRLPPRAVAQALRSVITNAQDAAADRDIDGDGAEVLVVTSRNRDGGLDIEVIDRGRGIPPETLQHVGEPFFTTKEPGRGMGLGLFLTRAVIESLGGMLEIDSVVGQGTCTTLRLPAQVRWSGSPSPLGPSANTDAPAR